MLQRVQLRSSQSWICRTTVGTEAFGLRNIARRRRVVDDDGTEELDAAAPLAKVSPCRACWSLLPTSVHAVPQGDLELPVDLPACGGDVLGPATLLPRVWSSTFIFEGLAISHDATSTRLPDPDNAVAYLPLRYCLLGASRGTETRSPVVPLQQQHAGCTPR